jgi:hypothetical protein
MGSETVKDAGRLQVLGRYLWWRMTQPTLCIHLVTTLYMPLFRRLGDELRRRGEQPSW